MREKQRERGEAGEGNAERRGEERRVKERVKDELRQRSCGGHWARASP